jgi:hypothetical protein
MKKEQNYDFDYVVPLEVIHKQYVKANKEYNKRLEEKRQQEEKKSRMTVDFIVFYLALITALMFFSYFVK